MNASKVEWLKLRYSKQLERAVRLRKAERTIRARADVATAHAQATRVEIDREVMGDLSFPPLPARDA